MPAPLAKGLIITASILVAAGLALYENPHVRQWVDNSRRKIAHALNNFGDDLQSRNSQDTTAEDEEARRKRREEIVRKNRAEMIRKAREEGIAVDLDELSRIGTEKDDKVPADEKARSRSFDDLVGSDGMLKTRSVIDEKHGAASTTATEGTNSEVRHRGHAQDGFQRGASFANPFADEHGEDLMTLEEPASSAHALPPTSSADSPATITGDPTTPHSPPAEPSALTPSASTHSLSTLSHSFHSLHPPSDAPTSPSLHSVGTMTPTSDSFSAAASVAALSPALAPSHPQLLLHHPQPLDLHSPLGMSLRDDGEGGDDADDRADGGMSDAGFSVVSAGTGIGGRSTPGDWTDVGSEEGMSEFGDARVQ